MARRRRGGGAGRGERGRFFPLPAAAEGLYTARGVAPVADFADFSHDAGGWRRKVSGPEEARAAVWAVADFADFSRRREEDARAESGGVAVSFRAPGGHPVISRQLPSFPRISRHGFAKEGARDGRGAQMWRKRGGEGAPPCAPTNGAGRT